MRSIDAKFYKSKEWAKCREEYLATVNHLCERCLRNGLVVPADIVHHKEHLNRANESDPTKTLAFDNLEALCRQCHNQEHFKEKEVKRWRIDGDKLIF